MVPLGSLQIPLGERHDDLRAGEGGEGELECESDLRPGERGERFSPNSAGILGAHTMSSCGLDENTFCNT